MKPIRKLIDWAAEKTQKFSGETERRRFLSELKEKHAEWKVRLGSLIEDINKDISKFNEKIKKLNILRNNDVKSNIKILNSFLCKFGRCKSSGSYIDEKNKECLNSFPENYQRNQIQRECYIKEVDWDQEEIFKKTARGLFFGQRSKTKKINLQLKEELHSLDLDGNEAELELDFQKKYINQDTEICELYTQNVQFISSFIENRIIPEMNLVESFFQANTIKDYILANQDIKEFPPTYKIDALVGTKYEKHYKFIKNTFMFYVISCKIYNSSVLTKLLANIKKETFEELELQEQDNDKEQLKKEHFIIKEQAQNVEKMCVLRR